MKALLFLIKYYKLETKHSNLSHLHSITHTLSALVTANNTFLQFYMILVNSQLVKLQAIAFGGSARGSQ